MITCEKKLKAVEAHLEGHVTLRELAEQHGVHHSTIEKWIHNYRTFGIDGLRRSGTVTRYTEEEKKRAVRCYFQEHCTLYSVCRKYKIRSISTLQTWIAKYKEEQNGIKGEKQCT